MSNFEEVCRLSCEKWIDSLPDEIPKHKFSKKHTEKMKELSEAEPNGKKHKPSKKTVKFLLIAAILLSLAVTAFANPAGRKFIVEKFFNHSEYNVNDESGAEKVTSLKADYIPEGFEKTEEDEYICLYRKGDESFTIQKCKLSESIGFDTEKYGSENIKINGVDAVYYKSENNEKGIIFNNGDYIFIISGNIDKEELVNIAQNVE